MIYAVIDTNVLVAALLTKNEDASTYRLARLLSQGVLTPLYDSDIIAEYMEVLSRPKFKFPKSAVNELVSAIVDFGAESLRVSYNSSLPDESDRVFYEVALSKKDAYLVAGNQKHFPRTPIVVTPAEMLDIVSRHQ